MTIVMLLLFGSWSLVSIVNLLLLVSLSFCPMCYLTTSYPTLHAVFLHMAAVLAMTIP